MAEEEIKKTITGVIKWFSDSKGYGFVRGDNGQEYFIHFSKISSEDNEFRTLHEGQKVTFEGAQGEKGPVASNVKVVT